MLRTSFIAMYKNLGVLGMAGLRPPAEQSGPTEQLSEPDYSPCFCDWIMKRKKISERDENKISKKNESAEKTENKKWMDETKKETKNENWKWWDIDLLFN